tara:strand:- start:2198 stop:2434 length:237 start_codon:yes stop_codon:yes gene_type:complete
MYGLKDTPQKVKRIFDKVNRGKATEKDYEKLESHIEKKKAEIRKARQEQGIDGVNSPSKPKLYEPLEAIMRHVDGGRR